MKRRGLSEIIGGMIVLLVLVSAALTVSVTLSSSLERADDYFTGKMETLLDQSNPPIILPYIIEENGTRVLRVYISPVGYGEDTTVYVLSKNYTIVKRLKASVNYINASLVEDYDCSPVYILVESSSGALYAYNALRDPRITQAGGNFDLKDPRLFTCNISLEDTSSQTPREGSGDLFTGFPLIGLNYPQIISGIPIKIGRIYNLTMSGWALIFDNGSKACSITIKYGDDTWITRSCSYSVEIARNIRYSLSININTTNKTVYGYLEVTPRSPGTLIEAKVYSRLTGNHVYYTKVPHYYTYGSLEDTYLPIIYGPIVTGQVYSKTAVIPNGYSYKVVQTANSTAQVASTGPILIFLSTNKLKYFTFNMKINVEITKIIIPITNTQTYKLGITKKLTIITHPLLKVKPADFLAEAINSIKNEDWNLAHPQIKITHKGTTRFITIEPNTILRIYNKDPFNASITIMGGYNIDPISSYQITEKEYNSGSKHGYIVTGYTVSKPIPLASHLPYIIEIKYNYNIKYLIAGSDYKQEILIANLTFPGEEQEWILYTYGAHYIDLTSIKASLGCVIEASSSGSYIPSTAINSTAVCSSSELDIEPQSLYLIILASYTGDQFIPAGLAYRLLWNS